MIKIICKLSLLSVFARSQQKKILGAEQRPGVISPARRDGFGELHRPNIRIIHNHTAFMNHSRPLADCYFLPSDIDSAGSPNLKAVASMCRYEIRQVLRPELGMHARIVKCVNSKNSGDLKAAIAISWARCFERKDGNRIQ
jgi:hypothetical protein